MLAKVRLACMSITSLIRADKTQSISCSSVIRTLLDGVARLISNQGRMVDQSPVLLYDPITEYVNSELLKRYS